MAAPWPSPTAARALRARGAHPLLHRDAGGGGEGKYEILETIITGADESEVFGAIEAFYAANPDVNMITGVDYYSNIIAQFIKNNNLQGQLLAGGSDLARPRSTGCARVRRLRSWSEPLSAGVHP